MSKRSKELSKGFQNKLFDDMIEEFNKYDSDQDEDFYREWYEEMDGSFSIILLLARELYQLDADMDKFKERLQQIYHIANQ